MFNYVVKDFKTAFAIEAFPMPIIQLQTPAMIGSRLTINGDVYEVKEIAHEIELSCAQQTFTKLYLEKIA
jgi:hypothetical protein